MLIVRHSHLNASSQKLCGKKLQIPFDFFTSNVLNFNYVAI